MISVQKYRDELIVTRRKLVLRISSDKTYLRNLRAVSVATEGQILIPQSLFWLLISARIMWNKNTCALWKGSWITRRALQQSHAPWSNPTPFKGKGARRPKDSTVCQMRVDANCRGPICLLEAIPAASTRETKPSFVSYEAMLRLLPKISQNQSRYISQKKTTGKS
jgi:hypothetical protein